MAARMSSAKRIRLQSVAEEEVMRFAGDHALWHKHIHNVELDPVQVLKMKEMDQHPNTIDFSSRRTGKTAVKEMYTLEYLACNSDQELGIVAPREAQALVNLGYHQEAIRRSEILTAYVAYKNGRLQMADSKHEFMNRSKAQAYGIMAQVDGGDLTMASLEEVDDMPKDRLYSRFLLTLGSSRRLGASTKSKNDPQIRITGVFKGADTLTDLLDSENYHALGSFTGTRAREEIKRLIAGGWLKPESVELQNYNYPVPILNAVNAMEMGLINKTFIGNMQGELSTDEFVRQLLCINTSSRNLVWEIYMRRAMQVGLDSRLEIVQPIPTELYKKRGLISFGYDHSGHGESPDASKYALVVLEQISNFSVPIVAKTWPPGTDEKIVKNDLKAFWRYFDPDTAIGDAYGIGLLTTLNDELYAEGLTRIDRNAIGDGESTASTWPDWAFAPLRFEGMVKHQMAKAVKSAYHNGQTAIPYFDENDLSEPGAADMRLMVMQIINIKPEASKTSYSKYRMADSKIGDDLFDAYMAAQMGLVCRGVLAVPTVIISSAKTREQLMGSRPAALVS